MAERRQGIADALVELAGELWREGAELLRNESAEDDSPASVDQTRSVNLPNSSSAYSEVEELTAYQKYGPMHPTNTRQPVRENERDR